MMMASGMDPHTMMNMAASMGMDPYGGMDPSMMGGSSSSPSYSSYSYGDTTDPTAATTATATAATTTTVVKPWQTITVAGDALSASLLELNPSMAHEVRVRGGNAAGWSNWSDVTSLETTGLPVGGACLQDDAPCGMDPSGKFVDVTYTYHGLGCEAPPVVSVVGGNCLVYGNVTVIDPITGQETIASGEVSSGSFASGEAGSGSGEWGSGSGVYP